MAGIKIVDLPPLGRDLASTDLLELSLAGGTGSRKITGQEIMNTSKLNIGTTAITSGTVGRVLFQGTGNVVQQSSSLFWDNTNVRLGVGTSTPITAVEVKKTGSDSWITASRGTNSFHAGFLFNPSGSWTASNVLWNFGLYANTNDLRYWTYNGSTDTNVLNLFGSTGNLGIGTTTDAGFRLDVNGTARVTNNLSVGTSSISGTQVVINGGQNLVATTDFYLLHLFGYNTSASSGVGSKQWITFGINDAVRSSKIGGINLGNNNYESGLVFNTTTGGSNLERLRILNNGNVLIGTTTDAGFKLDVNGTARVTSLFVNLSTGSIPFMGASGLLTQNNSSLFWDNTNQRLGIGTGTPLDKVHISTNGNNAVRLTCNASNGNSISLRDIDGTPQGGLLGTGTNFVYGTYRALQASINGGIGGVGLRTGNGANAHISFYSGNADSDLSTERIRLVASTGNFLINTTTDAGFRLDVNGTARVQGDLSSTGIITAQSRFTQIGSNSNTFPGVINHMGAAQSVSGLNTTRINANTDLSVGYAGAPDASAVIQANSTTRGFLPPRMTQAQRNAIASPAIGLEIYQTDATEGKYIYKSSGWTYIG